jgi:uncharacterized membrane protein YjgN (DUF898 family)
MKRYFSFVLSGRELFPIFILFYIPFVLSYGGIFLVISLSNNKGMPMGGYLIALFSCIAVLFVIYCVFAVLFSRKIIPAFSLNGTPFSFECSVLRFLGLNVVGALLSAVTLGIYTPWYLTKLIRVYAAGIGYKGGRLAFLGRGGRLFVVLLLTVCVPMVILIAFSLTVFRPFEGRPYYQPILQITSLVLLTPYFYEVYKWMINFRCEKRVIRWNTRFTEAVPRILLQIVLTIVTAGIYYPAAMLILYRYFASKTETESGHGSKGTFGFDGNIVHGFLLMWGQILLIAVTLGVYSPWGICKIWSWVSERSYLRE